MSEGQYISVREAAQILGISERKVMDMIENNELQAYKIANQFLRLKRSEVASIQRSGSIENESVQYPYTVKERVNDFFYYNDFYLIAIILIGVLIYIVLRA
jgi:excisionase family DNA binding protein